MCEASNSKLKVLFKSFESKLLKAHQRVQELNLTKETVDQLATKFDEAEGVLAAPQDHVQYLEDRIVEQSDELLANCAEAENEPELLSKFEEQVTSFLANLQKARVQNETDGDLLEGARTALTLQKRMFQQRLSNYVKELEKLVADNAANVAEFYQYRTDMDPSLVD